MLGHELIPVEKREEHRQRVDELQSFLERLQAFNTPAKLKNFAYAVQEVQAQSANLALLEELEALKGLVNELTPLTSYLTTAEAVLCAGDSWVEKVSAVRAGWQPQLLDPAKRSDANFRQKLLQALERCKREYQEYYLALHKKTRLGINEDERKRNLLKDTRLERLKKLTVVSLLPHASLTEVQNRLANLTPCYTLVKDDLATAPICPHCGFRPTDKEVSPAAAAMLDRIDDAIATLLKSWTTTLLSDLADPTAEQSIALLDPEQQKAVTQFRQDKALPETIDNALAQGFQNALAGLTPITVSPSDLLAALGDGNAPCTVDLFRSRFEDFVQNMVRGKEVSKVRFIISVTVKQPETEERDYTGHLMHRTAKGVLVRSKSEVIVADTLTRLGISYEYEQKLPSQDDSNNSRLPDFTISHEGNTYYWEHLGMLSVPSYKEQWERKRVWYEKNGYLDQLITSEDGPDGSIDATEIEQTARNRIL